MSVTKVSKKLSVSFDLANRYLENTYMIQTIPLFDWSLQKQFSNPKLELKRNFDELYYFKTKQGYEVDFLVKQRKKVTHLI